MQLCFFDIDGTLLNTGGAGRKAIEAVLNAEIEPRQPVTGIETEGRTDCGIVQDLLEFYEIPRTPETLSRFQRLYLEQLTHQLEACEGEVLPGVPELLTALSNRADITLGLLTGNYERGAAMKLDYYELNQHFTFGGFGDDHYHRDDVARAALVTSQKHLQRGADWERVWVIGDTPADIQCGQAIGATVIAVNTGGPPAESLHARHPDHFFENLAETETVLDLFDVP